MTNINKDKIVNRVNRISPYYFYITTWFEVEQTFSFNDYDIKRYEAGNFFNTKEEAEIIALQIKDNFQRIINNN